MQGEHAKNSQEKFIVIHGQDSHLQRINKENEHDNGFLSYQALYKDDYIDSHT